MTKFQQDAISYVQQHHLKADARPDGGVDVHIPWYNLNDDTDGVDTFPCHTIYEVRCALGY